MFSSRCHSDSPYRLIRQPVRHGVGALRGLHTILPSRVVGWLAILLVSMTAGGGTLASHREPEPQPTAQADADSESANAAARETLPEPEPEQPVEPEARRSFFSRLFRRTPAAGTAATSAIESSAAPGVAATVTEAAAAPQDERYTLRAGDEIRLDVFREPEISGSFRLTRPDGLIRHPLMGDVALKGLTVAEAEALVRHRLDTEFLVNPRVILQLAREPESPRAPDEVDLQVLVMGQVRKPGAVTFQRGERLTLLEAISAAGGFTNVASRNRVRIVRETDGKRESIRVRVDDILAGKQGHRNVELKPGDTINVPEVWF